MVRRRLGPTANLRIFVSEPSKAMLANELPPVTVRLPRSRVLHKCAGGCGHSLNVLQAHWVDTGADNEPWCDECYQDLMRPCAMEVA